MSDATFEPAVTEVVRLQAPWWTRKSAAIAGVLLAVTLLLFAAGSFLNGNDARRAAKRTTVQNDELKAQITKLTRSGECRSQRYNDLLLTTSNGTGAVNEFVILSTSRPGPEAFAPLLARLKADEAARVAAADLARTAVEDCKNG